MTKKVISAFLCLAILSSMFGTAFAAKGDLQNGSDQVGLPGNTPVTPPDDPDPPDEPDEPNVPDTPTPPPSTNNNNSSSSSNNTSSSTSTPSVGGGGGASSKHNVLLNGENDKKEEVKKEETPPTQTLPTVSYTDVPTTEWFYNAVVYVTQQGMMSGNNGKFSPYDPFTRAMMAQILYNMDGKPAVGAASYPDVGNDWYTSAIAYVSTQGLMSGYSNGNFGPNDPITREQLASTLYRYAQKKGYNVTASAEYSGFSDAAMVSDWAAQSIRWALGAKIISGKTGVAGTRLDPTGTATRAEVAQILMNFGQKIAVTSTSSASSATPAAAPSTSADTDSEDEEDEDKDDD